MVEDHHPLRIEVDDNYRGRVKEENQTADIIIARPSGQVRNFTSQKQRSIMMGKLSQRGSIFSKKDIKFDTYRKHRI